MNEYCMIEVAFGKQKEVEEVIDLLLNEKLVYLSGYKGYSYL